MRKISMLAVMFACFCFFLVGCGDGSDSSAKFGGDNNPSQAASSKTLVNVNTITGDIQVAPVIVNGKLINLVNSNPVEQVLDANGQVIAGYRIAWNDNGSWYPLAGKQLAITLPITTFSAAARPVGTGVGMPYLVRPDGTFVPFNTDPLVCTFMVNGVVTKINVDGLMPY